MKYGSILDLQKAPDGKAVNDGAVYCKLCTKKVTAKSGNTSNLKAHLKNNHKTIHCQLQKPSATVAKEKSSTPTLVSLWTSDTEVQRTE